MPLHHALALALGALIAGPALAAAETPVFRVDPAKGQQIAATCIACHSADGTRGSPANPILQGQHPAYIAKQLADFKAGRRKNAIMQSMAAPLSEDDMKQVAAFYGAKKPIPGFARNKDTVALGESIWRGGIANKQVPACGGCHSPNGAGIPAQYPRLAGQHADYSQSTLLAFRAGVRSNSAQMTTITNKMNDREIAAVADYMAGLR